MNNVMEAVQRSKNYLEYFLKQDFIKRKIKIDPNTFSGTIIKVIIGPRRSGKSTFTIMNLAGKKAAYLNFDDEVLLKEKNYNNYLKYINEIYGKSIFLILDEIQNLPEWEIFVNRLQRENYNLFITGSNSSLLSGELASHLTGRYAQITVLPFSFREILDFHNVKTDLNSMVAEEYGTILNFLDIYMFMGGFPEIIVKNYDARTYLQTLVENIIYKDIVARYGIRHSTGIIDMANYLINSYSGEVTGNSAAMACGINSVHTALNYMKYISSSFLVFFVERLSFKSRVRINSPKKVYCIDNGIISLYAFRHSEDMGKIMENTVAIELLRRSSLMVEFNFYYWRNENGKEVDFVIKRGIKIIELINVSYITSGGDIKKRELDSIISASREMNCDNLIIITWDYEKAMDINGTRIKCIPLWKWLIAE